MYRSQLKIATQEGMDNKDDTAQAPIKTLTLRDNQLHGSILIGNYNYLTHLEVSDNELESLDLSSLTKLETLKCNHNRLMELLLSGEQLTTVSLACNSLSTVLVDPAPTKLQYLNIAHNYFTKLPDWLCACADLQELNASYNRLQNITDFLHSYNIKNLRHLHLGCNHLQTLSKLPEQLSSLQHLQLQGNELQKLPENFFEVTHECLLTLNVSSNKLSALPLAQHIAGNMCLEEMLLTSNRLSDSAFEHALMFASKLRILHLAYNKITQLPEACLHKWHELEVLVLSGNMLQHLPAGLVKLKKLQVLRVHSNLLLTTPSLSKLTQLKILDLAHNHLDHINLLQLVPAQLKYLDLCCNLQLQVDEQQLAACQTQRKWSLIDVSGKNRNALPTMKLESCEQSCSGVLQKPPWLVGFSETPGFRCRKLLISQLRLCNFNAHAGLFGMFETACGSSASKMSSLIRQMPQMLQQQLHSNIPINESMKRSLQTLCQQLVTDVTHNVAATLCHIAREHIHATDGEVRASRSKGRMKHYVLRLLSVGNIRTYLVRKTSNVCVSAAVACDHDESDNMFKTTNDQCHDHYAEPAQIFQQKLEVKKIILSNEDEYMVMSNSSTWQVIDIDRVAREIRKEDNVVLAAKRVQNIAQSYGAKESLSVMVIRFRHIGTDVDHLIRELKEMSRSKPAVLRKHQMPPTTCYTERLSSTRPCTRSERSSPSGQSDHLGASKLGSVDGREYASLAHVEEVVGEEQSEDLLDETDSMLSEEQFKCWEYMLEQNTQLLFDKELNTISKAFSPQFKRYSKESKMQCSSSDELHLGENKMPVKKPLNNNYNKLKSISSPQLLYGNCETKTVYQPNTAYQQQLSLLSKQFGSRRSCGANSPSKGYNYFKSRLQDTLNIGSFVGSTYAKLAGGPNAAYFGSVQRQVPFNFKYDLAAVTQECAMLDENDEFSDEQEHRMSKYWGVATTEL